MRTNPSVLLALVVAIGLAVCLADAVGSVTSATLGKLVVTLATTGSTAK